MNERLTGSYTFRCDSEVQRRLRLAIARQQIDTKLVTKMLRDALDKALELAQSVASKTYNPSTESTPSRLGIVITPPDAPHITGIREDMGGSVAQSAEKTSLGDPFSGFGEKP